MTPEHLIAALREISQHLVKNNLQLPPRYCNIVQYLEIIELEAIANRVEFSFYIKNLFDTSTNIHSLSPVSYTNTQ